MTPEEFSAILEALFPDSEGKGQSAAARFLESSDRQVRRYVSGEQAVPAATAKFLRYLKAAGVTPTDVEAMLAKKPKRRR